VSIGTGKRPAGSDQNQHLWYEGFMGEFAEARRRLISKIEGCEETHQYMKREGLSKRGVNIENYYRLNVEIGVGEFGMNEWNRLADISTGTRRYLGKSDVQRMNIDAAAKLGKIHRAKIRFERERDGGPGMFDKGRYEYKGLPDVPEAYPNAVELPAEMPLPPPPRSPPPRPSYESGHHDTLEVPSAHKTPSPRSSHENQSRQSPKNSPRLSGADADRFVVHNPTPSQYQTAVGADKIAIVSADEFRRPQEPVYPSNQGRVEPPPLPPKTPIQDMGTNMPMGRGRPPLPYPVDDGPPPAVNMARKPADYGR
jgi:hypothetical protein